MCSFRLFKKAINLSSLSTKKTRKIKMRRVVNVVKLMVFGVHQTMDKMETFTFSHTHTHPRPHTMHIEFSRRKVSHFLYRRPGELDARRADEWKSLLSAWAWLEILMAAHHLWHFLVIFSLGPWSFVALIGGDRKYEPRRVSISSRCMRDFSDNTTQTTRTCRIPLAEHSRHIMVDQQKIHTHTTYGNQNHVATRNEIVLAQHVWRI